MKWDKVYAQVGPIDVEMGSNEGPVTVPVISFRMIAEIEGRAFVATHVITQSHYNNMPEQYGHILDEMVEFIDKQAGLQEIKWYQPPV